MIVPSAKNTKAFFRTHRTYWERLDVSDLDCNKYFECNDVPINVKRNAYNIYRKGLDYLLDELEVMEYIDYNVALYNIKIMGFCLPIRQKNYGWQEPLTLDELEDYLKKLVERWDIIAGKALDRMNKIKETKQLKLTDKFKDKSKNKDEDDNE